MNTKPIAAIMALIAGFVTCILSFVQHVDIVTFAKRFIIVCIVFFVIGTVIQIVINMNFNEMAVDETEESPESEEGEIETEDAETASEEKE